MAANNLVRRLVAALGERDRLVLGALDVTVSLEPADHLVHSRWRKLHCAGDVGACHRQPRLTQPKDRLQVLLFRFAGPSYLGAAEMILFQIGLTC